jgi:hypothetical protein
MKVVGWDNGAPDNRNGEGYGIRIVPKDRDRFFQRAKSSLYIKLGDGHTVRFRLSDSFWGDFAELRSPKIGKWMLNVGLAPWSIGSPPNLRLEPIPYRKFRLTS